MLRTDASKYAIGAVLEQEIDGKIVPVAFFSRKVTQGQHNWSPREQETYAIVASLRKRAGWIGYQPVILLTKEKTLEACVDFFVDRKSGHASRKAMWHENLSKIDITVK